MTKNLELIHAALIDYTGLHVGIVENEKMALEEWELTGRPFVLQKVEGNRHITAYVETAYGYNVLISNHTNRVVVTDYESPAILGDYLMLGTYYTNTPKVYKRL